MTDPQILLDYEAQGFAIAERPGILDDLREALECDEISAAIVEPLADDEPTRAHLAALRARAKRIREIIGDVWMERRRLEQRRAEAKWAEQVCAEFFTNPNLVALVANGPQRPPTLT